MKVQVALSLSFLSCLAIASDHNNLDKERPLIFEDAYSIAYRSFEFQNGFRLDTFRRERPVYRFRSELQYGFAKNRDFSVGVEPSYSTDSGNTLGNIAELSYFEGVRREIRNQPALGYRIDLGLPVSGQGGTEMRLRGILTRTANHYDKFHFNVDVYHAFEPEPGERQTTLGVILGYSTPWGYPKDFNQTLLGELGIDQSRLLGGGYHGWVGFGLRKQVSATGVVDFGLQSDLWVDSGRSSSPLRATVGYSFNF
jgi:hypothetical protein